MIKVLFLFLIGLISTLDFNKELLYSEHNEMRKMFGANELIVSSDLEEAAQKHSEFLLKNPDKFYLYSQSSYKDSFLGENKYVGKNNNDFEIFALGTWGKEYIIYTEYRNYDYALHFTQMVWKNTKYIGCGKSCNTEECYLVCHYYPPGNILKEFDSNIGSFYLNLNINIKNLVENFSVSNNSLEKFRNEITERHNYYRKQHNVGELERDSKLEKISQEIVEYMSEIDSIYYNSEKYMEESIGQSFFYDNKLLDGKEVADKWYSQMKNYDFENPIKKNNIHLTNGFTNLIWKNTKKIGCSYACQDKDKKENCYYCCTYYPGGIDSILMDNVLPNQELSENKK